jgi:hypothetical protein
MSKRYVATGDTYPHREKFTSWAWHWDSERRAWIEDNNSEPDWPGITMAYALPGVNIVVEEDSDDLDFDVADLIE